MPLIIPDSSCPPQDRRVYCCCPNIYVFIPYTVGAEHPQLCSTCTVTEGFGGFLVVSLF